MINVKIMLILNVNIIASFLEGLYDCLTACGFDLVTLHRKSYVSKQVDFSTGNQEFR